MVDDVPGLLRDFDFFVQPSLNEGISNTVLEAMASSLAVIATNVGGNPELIQDGVEGSLVAAADPAGLAEQLLAYIEDSETRRSRGAAARVRAVGEFSLDVMASRYEEFYTAVAA